MIKTYVDTCLDEDARPDDVDDWVDAWHDDVSRSENLSLDAFLGFTSEEYARWARDGSALQEILDHRRAQRQTS
ncbi:hypothetical protein CKJ81_08485 [Corynebacterium hadale]|uniref:Uncharacterized protein n=1 Tax=Corynebacterium hadale TaxID=2026255 RepID=A0A269PAL8_9CORY|nr:MULTISPECIES: hypothetical protein [Corynebacterium]PAJ68116.1 hypothetical protein CIG21_11575 [Corynebacterium hadale]PAT03274.1 hypothetical protein CKJ85_08860 [Corynebacterium sp. NML 150383]PAT05535.1 hypothetical protein CKJ81_08485 [Corynebacterium hadale]WKC61147.1 hypothetical protein CHAD_11545 [Corynebacterium hadale]